MYHKSVLLKESVDALDIEHRRDGIFVDVTFGGGGHSREILQRLGPQGRLIVFDQDQEALANVPDDKRILPVRSNFRFLENQIRYLGIGRVDGIIADLGVSSHQFDTAERGFSYRFSSALDMRMNQASSTTAADIVSTYSKEDLARMLNDFGEVEGAMKVASAICSFREKIPAFSRPSPSRERNFSGRSGSFSSPSPTGKPRPTASLRRLSRQRRGCPICRPRPWAAP